MIIFEFSLCLNYIFKIVLLSSYQCLKKANKKANKELINEAGRSARRKDKKKRPLEYAYITQIQLTKISGLLYGKTTQPIEMKFLLFVVCGMGSKMILKRIPYVKISQRYNP